MTTTADRFAAVRVTLATAARRAGRDPARVRLVAVTKTASAAALHAAWEVGQRDFGHNRIQVLEEQHALLPEARWHVIGPIQSNKIRRAAAVAALVHTIGNARVAAGLAAAATALGAAPLPVLVQVNLTPEDGRYGCRTAELAELLAAVAGLEALRCHGLMTIATAGVPPAQLRRHFAALRALAERAAADAQLPADPELSMGMSDDYEIAVEEGATLVRLGRVLFPSRNAEA